MSVVIRIFSWYTLVAYHSRISRADTCMLVLCWYLGYGLTVSFVLLCLCTPRPVPDPSAPRRGGFPADASGGGQPLLAVAGGDLQAALCQEGH